MHIVRCGIFAVLLLWVGQVCALASNSNSATIIDFTRVDQYVASATDCRVLRIGDVTFSHDVSGLFSPGAGQETDGIRLNSCGGVPAPGAYNWWGANNESIHFDAPVHANSIDIANMPRTAGEPWATSITFFLYGPNGNLLLTIPVTPTQTYQTIIFNKDSVSTILINFSGGGPFVYGDGTLHAWYTLDNLSYIAGGQLTLNGGTGAGPADPSTQSKSINGSSPTVAATFPLGAQFFLQLTNSDMTGVVSTFSLSNANIQPALEGPSLFSDHTVIEFSASTTTDTQYFQAAHLGTETLTITPVDTSLPSVTVSITISNPASLGNNNNQFDTSLYSLGHQQGIPPHFLKGQVQQESAFDPKSYRYEVLSVDLKYVSAGQNLRAQTPYALYRLATGDGLALGTDILTADISPRSIYDIVVGGETVSIADSDLLVSAANIYNTNDATDVGNWSTYSPKRAALVATNPTLLNFTAQTSLAASYGLLQILYSTALRPMGWSGISGAHNPSYLFDTTANLTGGGGSLSAGSGYVRRIFSRANPSITIADPDFVNPTDFSNAFSNAFNMYNHASTAGTYGPSVLSKAKAYAPVAAANIFQ